MKNVIVQQKITILNAMKLLDKTAEKCLIVVDENEKLLGTLTDGDIRRSILKGFSFSNDIKNSFNKDPKKSNEKDLRKEEVTELLLKYNISLLPIVDKEGKVKDYYSLAKLGKKKAGKSDLEKVPVVIMAGGMGTRLKPFTDVLPKPLIPIDGKPIIEHIIERFTKVGCKNFFITVNHKRKILKAYFEELNPNYNINFIEEKKPLGTGGSLRYMIDLIDTPFFVSNCDILINSDFVEIYNFHKKNHFKFSLVASTKEYSVPYGTCELDKNGNLSRIKEKPKYDLLINTGFYVLNPEILKTIPKNEFYHITQLIQKTNTNGNKVGVFPINDEAWIDVGQWNGYKKAIKEL
jgi:dTDP-glucose pyrophosphorylase